MKAKIIHDGCGGQLAWYVLDVPREPDLLLAKDWERMDGSKPSARDAFREYCPVCGEVIVDPKQVTRKYEA